MIDEIYSSREAVELAIMLTRAQIDLYMSKEKKLVFRGSFECFLNAAVSIISTPNSLCKEK